VTAELCGVGGCRETISCSAVVGVVGLSEAWAAAAEMTTEDCVVSSVERACVTAVLRGEIDCEISWSAVGEAVVWLSLEWASVTKVIVDWVVSCNVIA
jgi:uncharacterized membrane protein YdfJ with MMPL/SSD domain